LKRNYFACYILGTHHVLLWFIILLRNSFKTSDYIWSHSGELRSWEASGNNTTAFVSISKAHLSLVAVLSKLR